MKTVMEARSTIARMWGVPKKTEGQTYRLMDYILRTPCEDGTLLYNVVTSELVLLQPEVDLDSLLPGPYQPAMDELIQHHFAVPSDYDEKKSVDQLRVIMRKLNKPKYITGYTIYPTTCCNARCFYCFESDFVKETMTYETADAVVKYIIEHSGGNPISITWFGGEPLVGRHIIDYICNKLKDNGVTYHSNMISNAYLFDEDVVRTAIDLWKLKKVQVTLDGTEDVYNKTKAYVYTEGSPFQKVLNNIDILLASGVRVDIRLNVTNDNINNLFTLKDYLQERFPEKLGLSVYSHTVYGGVGYAPVILQDDTRDKLFEMEMSLSDELKSAKLSSGLVQLPHIKVLQCMADNDCCVTIFPSGKLANCENSAQEDAFENVFGDQYPGKKNLCKQYCSYEMCDHCHLYPNCLHLTICPEKGQCNVQKANALVSKYQMLLLTTYENHEDQQGAVAERQSELYECNDEM